jgi:hypothetical protein
MILRALLRQATGQAAGFVAPFAGVDPHSVEELQDEVRR